MKSWAINQLSNGEAEILLYGYIGSDEVNANEFTQEFKKLEATCSLIKLRVNSGGGSVFEGLAIFNVIKQSKCETHAYIDGLAASMASVIILACDKIFMSKMAMLMTHRPSGASMGNSDQLKAHAEMLQQLEQTITTIYAQRTGLDEAQVKQKYLGTADNWLSADQALAAKIVDGIYDAPAKSRPAPAPQMRNERDLVNYFTNYLTETDMKQIMLSAAALAALGITADAANDTAVEAKITALAQKAANADTLKGELTQLKEKLRSVEENADTVKAEALIDGAIALSKVVPGDREKWVKLAKADFESTKQLIDGIVPNATMEARMQQNGDDKTKVERLAQLKAKSGRQLYMDGELEELKGLSMEDFKAKWKDYTGKDWIA